MAKQITCCPINQIFWDPTGKFTPIDPPEPPAVFHIYYTTVIMSGGAFDVYDFGIYGAGGVVQGDPAGLASILQTTVTPDSGAGMDTGDASYSFWVRLDVEPVGWTWNGAPIVFTNAGPLAKTCYDTGEFGFGGGDPDPANWAQFELTLLMSTITVQGLSPSYLDAGFPALWASHVVQIGGVGAIGSFLDNNPRIQLTVRETYMPWVNNTSFNAFVGFQFDAFVEIACP